MYIRCILSLQWANVHTHYFKSFIRGEMLQYLPMCAH